MDKMIFTAHDIDLFINQLAKKIADNIDIKNQISESPNYLDGFEGTTTLPA